MRILTCRDCGAGMRIASRMRSANSEYVDWQCTKCMNRKTVCEGIMILSNFG